MVRGFIESAAEAGYHTMVYFLRFSNDAEFGFLADVRNGGIEGVAFWPQHASDRLLSLLSKFRRSAFPFVLIDRYLRGIEADFVVTDNERVACELTRALIERGHKHIGLISSEMDNTTTEDRMTGYRRALDEASLPYVPELTGVLEMGGEPVGRVVSRIMAHRGRPTAFVGANDGVTEKLADALTELGYAIPRNVELATVDDNAIAETMGIPMLTASQTGYEMGRRSAEVLADPHRQSRPSAPAHFPGGGIRNINRADGRRVSGRERIGPSAKLSPAPRPAIPAPHGEPCEQGRVPWAPSPVPNARKARFPAQGLTRPPSPSGVVPADAIPSLQRAIPGTQTAGRHSVEWRPEIDCSAQP